MKLALKINGQWAVLPADASISFVSTSPLFSSEKGDISLPFELDIHENSHIFHNLADTHGYVRLSDYHRLPTEVWYDGMQLFVGQTEVDDTVEFDGDTISINIISAGKSFADAIDGMNCRDVPLKDDIVLGCVPCVDPTRPLSLKIEGSFGFYGVIDTDNMTKSLNTIYDNKGNSIITAYSDPDPETRNVFAFINNGITEDIVFNPPQFLLPRIDLVRYWNDDKPYPQYPYCTAKICQPNGEKANEGDTGSGYYVTDVNDVNAAPSFYLLYFVDCLCKHLDISCDNSAVTAIEDMNRIMMLNTFPRYKTGDDIRSFEETSDLYTFEHDGHKYKYLTVKRKRKLQLSYKELSSKEKETKWSDNLEYALNGYKVAHATSDNFPDEDVSKVIHSMENAFGVVFDYDQNLHSMILRTKRDIMRSHDIYNVDCNILDDYVTREMSGGVCLSYDQEDNTDYSYKTDEDAVRETGWSEYDGYNTISNLPRTSTDTTTKYDYRTGNTFRVKVNEDTGQEPQLFKVATYNDVSYGKDNTGVMEPEVITIDFTPITLNDIWAWRQYINGNEDARPSGSNESEMAVFVDQESYGEFVTATSIDGTKSKQVGSTAVLDNVTRTYTSTDGLSTLRASWDAQYTIIGHAARDLSEADGQYSLEQYNAGFQLGIMRGKGVLSDGIEIIETNYDGEGNDSWGYFPARGGGVTADSVDLWGNPYDYNSDMPGGVSMDGRLSLQLDARKVKGYTEDGDPIFYDITGVPYGVSSRDMALRGLVPQLLEDYLYFMAHKVPVTLSVDMSISDVMALPYFVRVHIGTHVGFIYSKEYTINNEGITKITIKLYELNK